MTPIVLGIETSCDETGIGIVRGSELLADAVDATSRDDGWSMLAAVGAQVMKATPSFDPRNYGFRKLGDLVRAQDWLEIKQVPFGDGSPNAHILVRLKDEAG